MATTLDRPNLVTPGLRAPDPGVQTWWVRPGGATVVQVRPGDRLTVRDPHGGQPAEVTVLDHEGGEDAAALGARADAPATVLQAAGRDDEAAALLGAPPRGGVDPRAAPGGALFAPRSTAGAP